MRNIRILIFALIILSFTTISCEKDDILSYDIDNTAVNFNSNKYTYSFLNYGVSKGVVDIEFTINGVLSDKDRTANFKIIADSTTALLSDYEILSATVEADSTFGLLKVEVKEFEGEEDIRIYFEVEDGEDFKKGIANKKNFDLILSKKLIPPKFWHFNGGFVTYRLGTYSTRYWKFVRDNTGLKEIPYPRAIPGYNNDVALKWFEMNAIVAKIKDLVRIYNLEHPGKPLTHDDGVKAGQSIVVGEY